MDKTITERELLNQWLKRCKGGHIDKKRGDTRRDQGTSSEKSKKILCHQQSWYYSGRTITNLQNQMEIEEVFRFVKQELGFERYQSQSLVGQNNHFGTCFCLYAKLQDIAEKNQMTDYCIKVKALKINNLSNSLFTNLIGLCVTHDLRLFVGS